jgi:hydroxycarboxylate dehydrogenase B
MPVLASRYLQEVATKILMGAGAQENEASCVAASLVQADLAGHESHGVLRIVEYLNQMRVGHIHPNTLPKVIQETPTTVLVDGYQGFGQVIASWVIDQLVQKAKESGLAGGGTLHCGHIGQIGAYPAAAAAQGFLGLAFVNGGGTQPRVAPFGGRKPIFGTNPVAAAIPMENQDPLVLDFSTSVVSSGKIRLAKKTGKELPEGWILNSAGEPTRCPQDYYDGGMLLPAGGHKGYALSLLVEVLGGLLTGAGSPVVKESAYKVGNGVFFLLIKVEAFRPLPEFMKEMAALTRIIKAIPPQEGIEEVLLPGEMEKRTKAIREKQGIPIPDAVWENIQQAAQEVGIVIKPVSSAPVSH